ncbi:ras GTPase activating protein [Rutstroemia sp. NJR-2017a WRK4]|nr:ras GTPase activating protein [Rutstroemia sp. NJR-2017a WRK4]
MPRSRKQKRMIAYEANKLKNIACIEKYPQFVLLLPLVQDPSSTVSSALDAHSALTSNVIADAKKEIVANGKTSSASESDLLKNHPYHTWCALFELVARTPPTQQSKLIEFILGLQKIEVVDGETSQSDVLKYYDMEYWRQLPGFGWEARNMFDMGSLLASSVLFIVVTKLTFYKDVYSPSSTETEKTSYENHNAFLAQLLATSSTSTGLDEFEALDFSFFALRVLRDVFENEGKKSNDLAIRSACWWLVFATEKLWVNVVNTRDMPDSTGVGGDLYEKKGWKGFNRERWEIWREGLRNADKDRETGKLVKDGLACMERVMGSES